MAAALSSCRLVLVLRLGRSGLCRRLLAVAMLGAARTLGCVGALAAIHPAIAVGVAAAIGMSAVALLLAVTAMLGLAVLGVVGVAVMLAMALLAAMPLMLGMIGMALLGRRGRLGSRRSDEGEGRRGGDENGLHGCNLLNGSFARRMARAFVRRVVEAADRRRD